MAATPSGSIDQEAPPTTPSSRESGTRPDAHFVALLLFAPWFSAVGGRRVNAHAGYPLGASRRRCDGRCRSARAALAADASEGEERHLPLYERRRVTRRFV